MRFLCFIVLLLSMPAFAQEKLEDWPEGSAMHTGLLARQEHDEDMKTLTQQHKALLALIRKNASDISYMEDAVNKMHRAWLRYYPEECWVVGAMPEAGGSWPSAYATICEAEAMRERIGKVESVIKCIQKLPEEERMDGQNECVQPLLLVARP